MDIGEDKKLENCTVKPLSFYAFIPSNGKHKAVAAFAATA